MASYSAFEIVLTPTGEEGAGYRVKNGPGEFERPHLVDRGSSLVVQGDLASVLHGTLSPGGTPATLIVADFQFMPGAIGRRFRSAVIKFQFADYELIGHYDPEVWDISPKGSFSIKPTTIKQDIQKFVSLSVQGGAFGIGVNSGFTWAVDQAIEKQDQTTLTGTIRLESRVYGPKDTARWSLMENKSQKSSIPSLLRTAILLRRSSNRRFLGTVEIDCKVDFASSVENAAQRIYGRIPKDDPVVFDPNKAQTTAEKSQLENLAASDLEGLSAIITSINQSGDGTGWSTSHSALRVAAEYLERIGDPKPGEEKPHLSGDTKP